MRVGSSEAAEILRRTPAVLDAVFSDLSGAWAEGGEGPETWSPHETRAHMVAVEPTWIIGPWRRFLAIVDA